MLHKRHDLRGLLDLRRGGLLDRPDLVVFGGEVEGGLVGAGQVADRLGAAHVEEDDDLLLAELGLDGSDPGLVRCSVREQRCLVIDTD